MCHLWLAIKMHLLAMGLQGARKLLAMGLQDVRNRLGGCPHMLWNLTTTPWGVWGGGIANFKNHLHQPESGRSGLLLDIAFYDSWATRSATTMRPVRPRIDGRCDPHCGVPGKILEKDMHGGQVSITPPLFLYFPFLIL